MYAVFSRARVPIYLVLLCYTSERYHHVCVGLSSDKRKYDETSEEEKTKNKKREGNLIGNLVNTLKTFNINCLFPANSNQQINSLVVVVVRSLYSLLASYNACCTLQRVQLLCLP